MRIPIVSDWLDERREMMALIERAAAVPCDHKFAERECLACDAGYFLWRRKPAHRRPMEKVPQQ